MAGGRPSRAELEAARDRSVPDVIAPGLSVLFCGINPSLYSAATGHHFARPGNRFWPALHRSGFTPRRLAPRTTPAARIRAGHHQPGGTGHGPGRRALLGGAACRCTPVDRPRRPVRPGVRGGRGGHRLPGGFRSARCPDRACSGTAGRCAAVGVAQPEWPQRGLVVGPDQCGVPDAAGGGRFTCRMRVPGATEPGDGRREVTGATSCRDRPRSCRTGAVVLSPWGGPVGDGRCSVLRGATCQGDDRSIRTGRVIGSSAW